MEVILSYWAYVSALPVLQQLGVAAVAGFLVGILFTMALIRRYWNRKMSKVLKTRKDQFVGLASHYLLTPISIIQSAVTPLQESEGTLNGEERAKHYEMIARGAQRLWLITEQLLLVNGITANELRLDLVVGNLSETVGDAIAAMDIFAREKKITISFDDTIKAGQQARFDSRRLQQAVMAVLDNAIKFSGEEQTIEVLLAYTNGVYTIAVTDHGIGMPGETLTHLTEQFYRGNDLYNFNYEGLGLGVHIAEAILRLHQGNITFQSKPKQGTVATIFLPSL